MPVDQQTVTNTGTGEGKSDHQTEQEEPTPQEISSTLLDEALEVTIPPGLAKRIEGGVVGTTVQLVGDKAWDKFKATEPDLAARIEANASLLDAEERALEEENAARETEEQLAQELEGLPPEERDSRIQDRLSETVKQKRLGLRRAYAELRDTRDPQAWDKRYEEIQAEIGPAEQLAAVMGSEKTSGAAKMRAWNDAPPEVRELATQWFGLSGPADLDPTAQDYRDGLKDEAELLGWAKAEVGDFPVRTQDLDQLKVAARRVVTGKTGALASDRTTDHIEHLLNEVEAFPWKPGEWKEAVALNPGAARTWLQALTELRFAVRQVEGHHRGGEGPPSNIRNIEVEGVPGA